MNSEVKSIEDLPSPKGHLLLGNLLKFNAEQKHTVLEDWVKEVGSLFKINLLGKAFIVSADPEINLEILKNRPDQFRRFFKINEILSEMGIVGVFNAEGEQWQRHRQLTAEALNVKNVRGFFPTLQSITQRFLERWAGSSGRTIDVQKEMVRYTVDITTTIAFGYDINTLQQEENVIQDHMEKIFPMINQRITAPIHMWRYLKSKKDKELDVSLEAIENLIHKFIKGAREKLSEDETLRENPTNFLEALLVEQERSGDLSDEEVFGNVFTILLAGEDTTSNSISWTLFYIAQHPQVFQKLREEADGVFSSRPLAQTHEEVADLKYTEAVCLEAMRLKPVTPNLYMQTLEEVQIKNLKIAKGTTIMMQNKVAQTDELHFTNADQFIPSRWLPNGCPMHSAHSPQIMRAFGAGPRFCPGRNLAIQEMKMAISMICKNFDLEMAVKPDEVKEIFSFTMFPENLLFKIQERALSNL